MRQWVEENPGLVNSRSGVEEAPLYKVVQRDFLMLVTWLLEEKGADVNLRGLCAHTPLLPRLPRWSRERHQALGLLWWSYALSCGTFALRESNA